MEAIEFQINDIINKLLLNAINIQRSEIKPSSIPLANSQDEDGVNTQMTEAKEKSFINSFLVDQVVNLLVSNDASQSDNPKKKKTKRQFLDTTISPSSYPQALIDKCFLIAIENVIMADVKDLIMKQILIAFRILFK